MPAETASAASKRETVTDFFPTPRSWRTVPNAGFPRDESYPAVTLFAGALAGASGVVVDGAGGPAGVLARGAGGGVRVGAVAAGAGPAGAPAFNRSAGSRLTLTVVAGGPSAGTSVVPT